MAEPDADKAADALGILRSGREQVLRQRHREDLLTVATRSVGTVVYLGLKDVRDPVLRRSVRALWFAGLFGFNAWRFSRSKVAGLFSERQQRLAAEAKERTPEEMAERRAEVDALPWREQIRIAASMMTAEQKRSTVIALALAVGHPLVVLGFRRSRLRYPHVAAGIVLGSVEATVGLLRLRRRRRAPDVG